MGRTPNRMMHCEVCQAEHYRAIHPPDWKPMPCNGWYRREMVALRARIVILAAGLIGAVIGGLVMWIRLR